MRLLPRFISFFRSVLPVALIVSAGIAPISAQQEFIPIRSGADVDSLRSAISGYLLGGEAMPGVEEIDAGEFADRYRYYGIAEDNLAGIDAFQMILKNGFVSKFCVLRPRVSNRLKLPIIYHSGHGQGVFEQDAWVHNNGSPYSRSFLDFFLGKGFDIICMDMPMNGWNEYPGTVSEEGGVYTIGSHDDMFQLRNPFYYFIAPVKAAVDFLELVEGYEGFIMAGFSGGGWTTNIYSAIDTRILASFPASGSIPIPFRTAYSDKGDREQNLSQFYDQFNYSTLYFLGAAGENRTQLQTLNKYDNCCFMTDGTELWVRDIKDKFAETGIPGKFEFYFDTYSTWHKMSSVTMDSILAFIVQDVVDVKLKADNPLSLDDLSVVLCDNAFAEVSIPNKFGDAVQWYRDGQALAGETNRAIRLDEAGIYYADIHNFSGGAAHTDSIVVRRVETPEKPVIRVVNGVLYGSSDGTSSTEEEDYTSHWYYNGELIPGGTGRVLVPARSGAYTVIHSREGCESDFADARNVGVRIFPHPVRHEINLVFDADIEPLQYVLRTIGGTAVLAGKVEGGSPYKIDLGAGRRQGVYLLTLFNDRGVKWVEKIVVL